MIALPGLSEIAAIAGIWLLTLALRAQRAAHDGGTFRARVGAVAGRFDIAVGLGLVKAFALRG